jgi:uncharacterized membrane protein YbhN (UPF0104 family)
LPGLFGWFWELTYDVAAVWAVLLGVVALLARRFALLGVEILALGIVLAAGAVLTEDGTLARALTASDPPAVFPATRIALVVAMVVTASPHLALPFRRVGRWLVVLSAAGSIALGVSRPIGVLAAVALGTVGAMAARLGLGTPGGLPTREQVVLALADLGVPALDVRPAEFESRGVVLVRAAMPDGRPLLVKVFGRDARDGRALATVWANLWYRDDTSRLALSRRQQVEHEAFLTLLAERAGAPVTPLVSAGVTSEGDALVVVEADGTPLSRTPPDAVGHDALRRLWDALELVHASGIAHGRLDGTRLLLLADGSSVRIADFAVADRSTMPSLFRADEAQLLVATALAVGAERAIVAAREAIGDERLGGILPFLQKPVLEAETRRELKSSGFEIDELRAATALALGVEEPKLEQVRRVTWASVATAALLALGGYFLVSGIAGLGLEDILDELEGASSGWVVVGLALGPLVQVAQALSTLGASPKPVRFGPVVLLQFAVQFLALAVPSSASRIALNVRFFRGVGLTATEALAVGAVDSFAGFVVEALIVVVVLVSGAASLEIEVPALDVDPRLVAIVGLVLILLVIGALAVPKVRALVRAKVSEATSVLRVLRSPSKLALLIGGNVAARIVLAAILSASLLAFGERLPLAELLLVNTLVSLFAGIMPIPGGIGVAEAATTAGLVAFGVPDATAVATAIVFRLVTFYLPPIWGIAATRRLRQQGFI